MIPDPFNIEIDGGAPFPFVVSYQNPDGSASPFPANSTARMQVREEADPGSPIVFEYTDTSGLTLNDSAGTVDGSILSADGLKLDKFSTYHHDMFVYPPGDEPIKLFHGTIRMKVPRVTVGP
jgi:hypothetical protein